MDNALLSFFQQDKDLITDNRPLRLRLAHPTQMLEDVLLPQVVQGTEAICGSVEYRIMCVSLDAFIPLKELIALPVAIDIVTDRGGLRSICGIVTEARAGDSDGGLASYQLVLRDALSIMEKRTNTRVFRNKNEVEIVTLILDEWMQTNPIIGTCFRYEMDELFAHQVYPQREFTMQYNESDAAFIRRLLKRRGIAWYFRANQSNSPSHTMVLFNHPDSLPPNAAGLVRYHRDAATEERDTINSWCAVRTLQPASVTRFSWDYKNPQGQDFMRATARGSADQGESGNEMAASLDDYQVLSPHAGDDYDDLCQLGQLAMSRHDLDSKCFHGEGSVRDMCVGEYFTLDGHPEVDGHPDGERDFVLTSMQLAISSNLSKGLAERVQRVFSRNRWSAGDALAHFEPHQASTRVKLAFTAVRRGISIVPAYDPRSDVPNIPMQSATVVGPVGEEVYCDELGRVKIRFRSTRPSDHEHAQGSGAADKDHDSAWVRVASNWAGGERETFQVGQIALPRIGTEVLIAFLGSDPDRPVIVGQLYGGNSCPPALEAEADLPSNRHITGIRSREVHGSGSNQLRFDDTPGEISAQLSSSMEDSQLNLGYLTRPRICGNGEPRGVGAELRSGAITAIRGAGGLLLSGWRHTKSDAPHCESNEFITVLDESERALNRLGAFAENRGAVVSAVGDLGELSFKYDSWQEPSSHKSAGSGEISITSPSAIAIATTGTVASYAMKNSYFFSNQGVHVHAGQSASIVSVEHVSIFASEGDIKAIAAKGNFVVQSQSGTGEVLATKDLRFMSTDGTITAIAKEIKLVSADGSYIKIGDGITFGTDGIVSVLASKFIFDGPSTLKPEKNPDSYEDKAPEEKREVEIEFVDADGNSPHNDELMMTFIGVREERTQKISNGRGVLRDLPSGAFKVVQKSRLA